MLGFIDGVANGELIGWALDPARSQRPVMVEVHLNGKLVCRGRAWQHRLDVANACGTPGSHGFSFDLRKYCPGETGKLTVTLPNGTSLEGSPGTVTVPEAERTRDDVVMFMHIPKTAGTSLRYAIEANFRASHVLYVYPHPPGLPGCDIRLLPREQLAAYRAVIGHFRFGTHTELPHTRIRYATTVRDPLPRALSHFFLLDRASADAFPAHRPGQTLEDRICEAMERYLLPDNLLVRYFAGIDDDVGPAGTLTDKYLNDALANVETWFQWIGHSEQPQQFYDELASEFGWKPVSLGRENVGGWKVRPEAMPEISQVFARTNSWDLRFYEEILRLFPKITAPETAPAGSPDSRRLHS